MTYRLFCLGLVFVLAACSNHGRREASATQALLGGPSAQADGSYAYDLTIVFSNDIHDHIDPVASTGRGGMARHVTAMRLLREQATSRGKEILAINAGDNFEGSLFYETDGGALLFELLEMAGYDVVQVGNHDHQFGVQALFDVLSRAFPGFQQNLDLTWGNVNPSRLSAIGTDPALAMAGFLPAQVAPEIPGAFENAFTDFDQGLTDPALMDAPLANSRLFNQTLFFDRGGLRIGVFGIDTDEILYSAVCGEGELFLDPGGRAENLRFYPPATHRYASDMIDYLSDPDGDAQTDDGADLIIAVTHVGTDVDLQIAQTAMGQSGRRIDVIVGGHSHDRINTDIIVDHGGGVATHVVQAGAHGELLGRLDLSVDPATNTVDVRSAGLIQLDARFAADPAAMGRIETVRAAPMGPDALFNQPFDTVLAINDQDLPGALSATSAMGSLAADACRVIGNQAPGSLGLDVVLLGNFVFRDDLAAGPVTASAVHAILPLHQLTRTGFDADELDFIDLPGGLRQAGDPSGFPVPNPNLTGITALEYFLELVYGIGDLLAQLGGILGFDLGAIDGFIDGLQWSGIEFTIDDTAPVLQRIDPASIIVGGVPLVGNESMNVRLGLNAIIARVAMPFFQLFATVEEPVGSGILVGFPNYDPVTNASGLIIWEALRDHLAGLGQIDANRARVGTDRPRSLAPDLSFNPADVGLPAFVAPGTAAQIVVPVINLGATAVTAFSASLSIDPTPDFVTDDPDGFTDARTGFDHPIIGTAVGGAVSAQGQTILTLGFMLPANLPAGVYPLRLRIGSVQSADPTRPESIRSNNQLGIGKLVVGKF